MYDYYVILESFFYCVIEHIAYSEREAWEKYEDCCNSSDFVEILGVKNGEGISLHQSW